MFFLIDALVSVNRLCGRKAISADAAQLCLFTEQKELGFTEVVPYITLAVREKGAVSFICVHFSVEISWQREVRRQDEIWSVCKHIDLCASAYVHKRWAVIYVEMTRKGQVPGIHFFCKTAYGERATFFDVILPLKMKFQTLNCVLYWIIISYRTLTADNRSFVFVNCRLFCT